MRGTATEPRRPLFSTLTIVLPVFALILAGWLARRLGLLGPGAATELNRFVVFLALPALLFDIVAHARWAEIWQPGFIGAFGLSALAVFGLTLALRLRGRPLADAAIDALNAGYANTGFIGFPLALAALGRDALAPTLVASIITVCVLFALAIVLIEVGMGTGARGLRLALDVGARLARNPLLLSPALGALVPLAGLGIPVPAERFLNLLGGSASPCALVALGLFLAAERAGGGSREARSAAVLVGFKLVLQPVLAWGLAEAFGLPSRLTHAAVLLAALPTGTGPFMLAELYRRDAGVTCKTILASTVLSVATVSAYLATAT